jgi:hypothetical protein
MTYFNSRDVAAIALCASLWAVLNAIFAPAFFRMFGLPFLCDLIGFAVLGLAAWWIRKTGAVTVIGFVATAINFILVPGGFQFIGFTAASIFFDVMITLVLFRNALEQPRLIVLSIMPISVGSAAIAGYVIGSFFMTASALANWGGPFGWAGLHAIGGIIGGAIGAFLVTSLNSRRIVPQNQSAFKREAMTKYGTA